MCLLSSSLFVAGVTRCCCRCVFSCVLFVCVDGVACVCACGC